MTPEELLKPRWRAEIYYPGSPYYKGQIFTKEGVCPEWPHNRVTEFPHIFRQLEWWEEREDDELPKYVLGIRGHTEGACKIVADISENFRKCHKEEEIEHRHLKRFASHYLPITEAEYLEWKSKQQTKQ